VKYFKRFKYALIPCPIHNVICFLSHEELPPVKKFNAIPIICPLRCQKEEEEEIRKL
jgi:hypothetical protein